MSDYPPLAIGAVEGGPDSHREWSDAVMKLMRQVKVLREGLDSPLAVNVVFQVPGRYLQPEFEGVRTGRFSRKDARLLIQAALPEEPAADPELEVRHLLREAVELAEDFARQEGIIEGQLVELRELLSRL